MPQLLALLTALLLLLATGCVASDRSDAAMWHGDVRFSATEREAIVKGEAWIAMQAGHEPGGVAFDLEVADGAPPAPRTIRRELGPKGEAKVRATGECLGGAVFLSPDARPEINAPALSAPILAGMTAHEMAHCRYGFVDAYRPGDAPSDGIMRNLAPMRWTEAEEAQCRATDCRAPGR